jgi:ribosomal protein S8
LKILKGAVMSSTTGVNSSVSALTIKRDSHYAKASEFEGQLNQISQITNSSSDPRTKSKATEAYNAVLGSFNDQMVKASNINDIVSHQTLKKVENPCGAPVMRQTQRVKGIDEAIKRNIGNKSLDSILTENAMSRASYFAHLNQWHNNPA